MPGRLAPYDQAAFLQHQTSVAARQALASISDALTAHRQASTARQRGCIGSGAGRRRRHGGW